jgi:hypothetical protein
VGRFPSRLSISSVPEQRALRYSSPKHSPRSSPESEALPTFVTRVRRTKQSIARHGSAGRRSGFKIESRRDDTKPPGTIQAFRGLSGEVPKPPVNLVGPRTEGPSLLKSEALPTFVTRVRRTKQSIARHGSAGRRSGFDTESRRDDIKTAGPHSSPPWLEWRSSRNVPSGTTVVILGLVQDEGRAEATDRTHEEPPSQSSGCHSG